ncbi:MAG TPA: heterodisulfide reductase-related iron-sulfur binding cluster, partial [Herpetosiphonaceae bacterium]|nr:heterodisulfide reductase-related iron-sulfur binding cluster [Herpetosiphonaceae bacterium]
MIFYGFLALFIGTDIIAAEQDFTIPVMGPERGRIIAGSFYTFYEFTLDTLGLLFVAGLCWATYRRYVRKPDRLDNRNTDWWVLGVMLFIGIGGFLIEGLRILNQTMGGARVMEQSWARWNVVGYPLALLFRGIGLEGQAGLIVHRLLWVPHMIVTFAFVASIPYTKFKHIFYTPLNGFFRDLGPKGALKKIEDIEDKPEAELGLNSLAELSWKERMSLDACMRCGRCQSKCPAYAAGTDLSPKWLITKLDDLMRGAPVLKKDGTIVQVVANTDATAAADRAPTGETKGWTVIQGDRETLPLYGNLISENELWSCTTCRACMTECPAMIEHVDDIVGIRRKLALVEGEVPASVSAVLQGIERNGNPWKLPQRERTAWTEGLEVPTLAEVEEVDVLYWVGCTPSYDARSRKTARAMVQLMQRAGVRFAILGEEETCTGDPARRMGEEFLYQEQAKTNVETMGQYKFKRVVTTCAHCFNTIRNEYPQFGGNYEVIHHTQFLAELVRLGNLAPSEQVGERVAYHDPCYIGRYNDVYDDPRTLLGAIPGVELVEVPEWNREKAMCCGGGGGNVWMEKWGDRSINVIRLEQIQKAEPTTLAMGCPFCMVMFEDAAKNTGVGDILHRKDVAELLLESLPAA